MVRKLWHEEKAKLSAETQLQTFETETAQLLRRFDQTLNMAASSLQAGKPTEAQKWLEQAIKTERASGRLLKKMQRLEKELRMWTEMEIKTKAKVT